METTTMGLCRDYNRICVLLLLLLLLLSACNERAVGGHSTAKPFCVIAVQAARTADQGSPWVLWTQADPNEPPQRFWQHKTTGKMKIQQAQPRV